MTDTIAAVATGLGQAGIGIVRISGPAAFFVARAIFSPAAGGPLAKEEARRARLGWIIDGERRIDQVLALPFAAPASYTGEDVVEFSGHGGPFVLDEILRAALGAGARLAEPGEFSRRAFVNGKMDLAQAEAVMELIGARNEAARRSAALQLAGAAAGRVADLRARVLDLTAQIEAALDDPDNLEFEGGPERAGREAAQIRAELERLLEHGAYGRKIAEGIPAAIIGKPNAGKSSLLNALLGEDRAIVTAVAGTTRDVLTETLRVGDIHLNLMDTAGIRETEDEVEKIGVERARAAAQGASLLLFLADNALPWEAEDDALWEITRERPHILILNKTDIAGALTPEEVLSRTGEMPLPVSAKTGEGLDELRSRILDVVRDTRGSEGEEWFFTNLRQQQALRDAAESLKMAEETAAGGLTEELMTTDLMDAYESLGRILGESVSDDLAEEIFAKFCMGK